MTYALVIKLKSKKLDNFQQNSSKLAFLGARAVTSTKPIQIVSRDFPVQKVATSWTLKKTKVLYIVVEVKRIDQSSFYEYADHNHAVKFTMQLPGD